MRIVSWVTMVRGAGGDISGNSSTSYVVMSASDIREFNPEEWSKAVFTLVARWNPATTQGGLRIRDDTNGVNVVTLEPGVSGWRTDVVDITDVLMQYRGARTLVTYTRGDGATAPWISSVVIKVLAEV